MSITVTTEKQFESDIETFLMRQLRELLIENGYVTAEEDEDKRTLD